MGGDPQSGIHDQCSPRSAKAAVMMVGGLLLIIQQPMCSTKAVRGPLALARLTTVLLVGGDVIRQHGSQYRMWDIISKLTLLK